MIKKAGGSPTVHYKLDTYKMTEWIIESIDFLKMENENLDNQNFNKGNLNILTSENEKFKLPINKDYNKDYYKDNKDFQENTEKGSQKETPVISLKNITPGKEKEKDNNVNKFDIVIPGYEEKLRQEFSLIIDVFLKAGFSICSTRIVKP